MAEPRTRSHTPLMSAAVVGALLILASLLPQDLATDLAVRDQGPSGAHWLGTDHLGRDVVALTLRGIRNSALVGVNAAVISGALGLVIGVAMGLGPRGFDAVGMRLVEITDTVPTLLLAIMVTALLGPSPGAIVATIALTHWSRLARIIRVELSSLRSRDWITAAIGMGATRWHVAREHVLPAVAGQVAIAVLLAIPGAIGHESTLSFLGLGFPPGNPSLGTLLADAPAALARGQVWPVVAPAVALVLLCPRAALGDSMGSRTQLYSLVALGCLLATMFVLGPVLAAFPEATLAAVVIYAAIQLVDVPEFRRLARFRLAELVLSLATALAVVLFNVLIGIAIAVVLSLLDLVRRIANPEAAVLGYVPGLAGMHDITDFPQGEQVPGLVVFRYDSPLFFANAENFRRRALAAVDEAPGEIHWFLLNVEANTQLDLTAIDALEEVRRALEARGVVVALARVKQDTRDELARAGFLERLNGRAYPTLPTAVEAYVNWVTQTTGEYPAWAEHLPLPRNDSR